MRKNKFLYVHKFEWVSLEDSQEYKGSPAVGAVYPAEEHGEFYTFGITGKDKTKKIGFQLQKDAMEGDYENWDCHFEEITLDNLFDLDISTRDLKKMAGIVPPAEPLPAIELEEEKQEPIEDINTAIFDEMGASLFNLQNFDEDVYEALVMITRMVADSIVSTRYVKLTDGLEWNEPEISKVSNIAIATHLLERYINEKNPMKLGDIIDAIYQLTVEVSRVHKIAKIHQNNIQNNI